MDVDSGRRTVFEAFSFCPACGSEQSTSTDPLNCACGFVFYFNPACAVGALILDAEGQLLCIRRGRDPGKGKLGLPGGFIDRGETAEEAARREAKEEVGLELGELDYLVSHTNSYTFQDVCYEVVDLFFVARVDEIGSVRSNASEVSEWFLTRPEELTSGAFAFRSNWLAVEALAQRC